MEKFLKILNSMFAGICIGTVAAAGCLIGYNITEKIIKYNLD